MQENDYLELCLPPPPPGVRPSPVKVAWGSVDPVVGEAERSTRVERALIGGPGWGGRRGAGATVASPALPGAPGGKCGPPQDLGAGAHPGRPDRAGGSALHAGSAFAARSRLPSLSPGSQPTSLPPEGPPGRAAPFFAGSAPPSRGSPPPGLKFHALLPARSPASQPHPLGSGSLPPTPRAPLRRPLRGTQGPRRPLAASRAAGRRRGRWTGRAGLPAPRSSARRARGDAYARHTPGQVSPGHRLRVTRVTPTYSPAR